MLQVNPMPPCSWTHSSAAVTAHDLQLVHRACTLLPIIPTAQSKPVKILMMA
jgi:hypothetical protein